MILQRLSELGERAGHQTAAPALYAQRPIRYLFELDASGQLLAPPVDTADPAARASRRGTRRSAPSIVRTSGIKPLLFADQAEYTFGLAQPGSRPERVETEHAAYLALVAGCEAATAEPAVATLARFLAAATEATLRLPADFDRGASCTFRVAGVDVIDLPAVQRFWASLHDPAARGAPTMECIVCGRRRPVVTRLPGMLKGVPGGNPSGTSLISANSAAFESYGLEASLVSPICLGCAQSVTQALNGLLADSASRVTLGGMAFVAWTREPVEFSFATYLAQPTPQLITTLLEAVRRGGPTPPLDETAFYGLVVSGRNARAVVRDWIDTTVGEAKQHLARWFEGQRIVGPAGEEPRPLGLYELATSTVRVPRDLGPVVPRSLLHAALAGTPVPWDILYQAVRRNRAEQGITPRRVSLIKLVLTTHDPGHTEGAMVQLDIDHPDPAYHCGRLLAVIEEVQRAALPNLNATVVDRFFGTASTAPASVFGRLLRGAQPHLSKLERDRPGAYVALQRRLEEVQARLAEFPRILTLQQQGLFALGYYHQRAADRAAARSTAERARERTAESTSNDQEVQP